MIDSNSLFAAKAIPSGLDVAGPADAPVHHPDRRGRRPKRMPRQSGKA